MSKILNPLKWIDRLKARFRLWDEACPRCNSDAPAVDTCRVCWNGNLVGSKDQYYLKRRWRIYKKRMEREEKQRKALIKRAVKVLERKE